MLCGKDYKDIFIDFDDTLYDTRGNAIIALTELFEWAGLNAWFPDAKIFYDAYWKANVSLWAMYSRGEIDREYLIVERFRQPLAMAMPNPTNEYCLRLSDKFLEFCSSKPGLVDGAHHLVSHLKQRGYRLHICSNGFHEVQYKKIDACGLNAFFDTIILSEDAHANKPSPLFFQYALKQSNATPASTIMIGDNYYTDIIGAQSSGIDTILFNRWDPDFVPPKPPTCTVISLSQITYLL